MPRRLTPEEEAARWAEDQAYIARVLQDLRAQQELEQAWAVIMARASGTVQ